MTWTGFSVPYSYMCKELWAGDMGFSPLLRRLINVCFMPGSLWRKPVWVHSDSGQQEVVLEAGCHVQCPQLGQVGGFCSLPEITGCALRLGLAFTYIHTHTHTHTHTYIYNVHFYIIIYVIIIYIFIYYIYLMYIFIYNIYLMYIYLYISYVYIHIYIFIYIHKN
jgi:hypothetical protein